jgi:hypothetical protein
MTVPSAAISAWNRPASLCPQLARERNLNILTSTDKEAAQLLESPFGGTPLLNKARSTAAKLHGFVHKPKPLYTRLKMLLR